MFFDHTRSTPHPSKRKRPSVNTNVRSRPKLQKSKSQHTFTSSSFLDSNDNSTTLHSNSSQQQRNSTKATATLLSSQQQHVWSNSSLDAKNPPSAHRLYRTSFAPRDNKCHVTTTGGMPPHPPCRDVIKKITWGYTVGI